MNIICVTNKKITEESGHDFYSQVERIAGAAPEKIILREKELSEDEYIKAAKKCFNICKKYDIAFAVNKFINAAKKLGIKNIHLSFDDFLENKNKLAFFNQKGVSVHSVEEAVSAEKNGADYIICGHIFETDCKRGVLPRGTKFLTEIIKSVKIPVYAIGGINEENIMQVKNTGVSGVCLMSSLMKSGSPEEIIKKTKE